MGTKGKDHLTNPEAWLRVLPEPLFAALAAWSAGQPYKVTHRSWLTDGRSGSYVAVVRLQPERGTMHGAILKLLPPNIAADESRGVALANQYSPVEFRRHHLIETTERSPLQMAGWWLHRQDVAQADLAQMSPLRTLINEEQFPDYCHAIVSIIVTEWNQEHDPVPHATTAHGFLTEFLRDHLDGLAQFADTAGIDIRRPTAQITVLGRADPLPNPLALLSGDVEGGSVEIFVGNGHGDLHLANVFVPAGTTVDPAGFRLIDSGRFSPTAPVSRDPVKLLLSVAGAWLPTLKEHSSLRSSLAELIVAPTGYPAAPPVAGYLAVSRQIYTAAAQWGGRRGIPSEWAHQHLLVLVGSALRTVADRSLAIPDRWWYFEVAALAARAFLEDPGTRKPAYPTTPPTLDRSDSGTNRPGNAGSTAMRHAGDHVAYPGVVKYAFSKSLADDWLDLADLVEVPDLHRRRFDRGYEAQGLWEWLEVRGRLGDLRPALVALDRPDLVRLLDQTT